MMKLCQRLSAFTILGLVFVAILALRGSRRESFYIDQNQNYSFNKTVFITGSTGLIGFSTVQELVKDMSDLRLKLLARNSSTNRQKLAPLFNHPNIEIIWGDIRDYDCIYKGVSGSDYVLHLGGLVTPIADDKPYDTEKVNLGGTNVLVKAILAQPDPDRVKLVFMSSVTVTGDRNYPIHWGRIGDPIKISIYDHYGISKAMSERAIVESGIKNWVILRESGVLHKGLFHHIEPIMYTVPLNGVIEWSTIEDTAILLNNLIRSDPNSSFWQHFYHIGSGEEYRLTHYQFESKLLGSIGLSPLEYLFDPNWFSTKNFHGHFSADSDVLEDIFHFRQNIPADQYFDNLADKLEFYFRIPRYILCKKLLGSIVKIFLKHIAKTKVFGSLDWVATNNMDRITAHFGSLEEYAQIPNDWKNFELMNFNTSVAAAEAFKLDHGFNESKPVEELDIEDMKQAAAFRGGECLSETMTKGDMSTKLKWKCGHCGKEFEASPNIILFGGHWCPHCYIPHEKWEYDAIAKDNPFFAQVWYNNHRKDENNVYVFDKLFTEPQWKK